MKLIRRTFFKIVHNCIAHPLITVGDILFLVLALVTLIIALIISLFTWRNPMNMPIPDWVDYFNPTIAAERFHDWTADRF